MALDPSNSSNLEQLALKELISNSAKCWFLPASQRADSRYLLATRYRDPRFAADDESGARSIDEPVTCYRSVIDTVSLTAEQINGTSRSLTLVTTSSAFLPATMSLSLSSVRLIVAGCYINRRCLKMRAYCVVAVSFSDASVHTVRFLYFYYLS